MCISWSYFHWVLQLISLCFFPEWITKRSCASVTCRIYGVLIWWFLVEGHSRQLRFDVILSQHVSSYRAGLYTAFRMTRHVSSQIRASYEDSRIASCCSNKPSAFLSKGTSLAEPPEASAVAGAGSSWPVWCVEQAASSGIAAQHLLWSGVWWKM